jgi:hypothetical protein
MSIISTGELRPFYYAKLYLNKIIKEKIMFDIRNIGCPQFPLTAKYKPWDLITCQAFNDRSKALSFEKYLKSHSGKAFANKRLW